jgi:hypothetical protein
MAERVEIKMSAQLKEKVDAAREYIENKYSTPSTQLEKKLTRTYMIM